MDEQVFISYPACSVASGDCFVQGLCLARCQTQLPPAEANRELTEALGLIKEMRDYIITFRSVTRYVDESSIDMVVKTAEDLLKRNSLG